MIYGNFGKFTEKARLAIQLSRDAAVSLGHDYIGTEHLLLGLIRADDSVAAKALETAKVTAKMIEDRVRLLAGGRGSLALGNPQGYTPKMKRIFENSLDEARHFSSSNIATEHLLIALIKESDCAAVRLLVDCGVNLQKIYDEIMSLIGEESASAAQKKRGVGAKSDTPTLDAFSRDFTKLAEDAKFDPIIGREREIERVIQIISRRTKNNPCLVGDPGVGKTAIAEGLAQKIVQGAVPENLKGKRIVSLDLSAMVAGTKYRGEFEERIKKTINEVKSSGNVILFLDELHTIIGAGGAEGSMDASNILKPSLSRGELQLIGATTLNEYRKHIEKDAALERRFQPVMIDEPSQEEAILMLRGLRDKYEAHHNVEITDEAIDAAVKLSARYISDRFLPDKAIDLIDEASSKKRVKCYTLPPLVKELEDKIQELEGEKENAIKLEEFTRAGKLKLEQSALKYRLEDEKKVWEAKNQNETQRVGAEEVAEVVGAWTNIPVMKLQEEESQRLLHLEDILHERVVGQSKAVGAVAKAIRRGRVGLKDPKRPTGSFLFLGPTGVGKTELSRAVAAALFGSEDAMIRVDMSEYMEKHSVSKMVGSPPGYVGYEEGGQLSEKIRRKPYSVLLFDEIEKAHPDVFNILLQILDDGHITDAQGRKVDFKNTIVIMTSNAGAREIVEPKRLGFVSDEDSGKNYEAMRKNVMDEVKRLFKPEFINRIDDIIVFHQLERPEILQIAELMLSEMKARILHNMQITLTLSDEVAEYVAKEGYDPHYGARPLRRVIQTKIEDSLAESILDGTIKAGGAVKAEMSGGAVVFVSSSSR